MSTTTIPTKTVFELPDHAVIVAKFTIEQANKLGSLLKRMARETEQPERGVWREIYTALDTGFALDESCPFLSDAECSLARGQTCLEQENA